MGLLKRLFAKIKSFFNRRKKTVAIEAEVIDENYIRVREELVNTNDSFDEVAADMSIKTGYLLSSRLDTIFLTGSTGGNDFSIDNVSQYVKDFYANCDIEDVGRVVKWLSGMSDFNIDAFRYNDKVIVLGLLFTKFNLNVDLIEDFLVKGLNNIYVNNDRYLDNALTVAILDRITLIASIRNIPDDVLQRATFMYCYTKKASRVDVLLACKDYIGFMDSNLDWRDIDIVNSNI